MAYFQMPCKSEVHNTRETANVVKDREKQTVGLWLLSGYIYALEGAWDLCSDIKFSRAVC